MRKRRFLFKMRFKTRLQSIKIILAPKSMQEKKKRKKKVLIVENMDSSHEVENTTTFITYLCLLTCLIVLIKVPQTSSMMNTNCLLQTPSCLCSWKSGKFVADCSNQNLNQVPMNDYHDYLLTNAGNNQMSTLNRDIQQLNLESNSITEITSAEFSKKKFKNLQKIKLNSNRISHIDLEAFSKLTGLIELDLSENLISSLNKIRDFHTSNDEEPTADDIDDEGDNNNPSFLNGTKGGQFILSEQQQLQKQQRRRKGSTYGNSFLQDLTQVRILNLTSNQITSIEEYTFSPLTQLRQLYLSRNKISFIDKNAFDGSNVLNILHLDGNKLSQLDGEILLNLPALHSVKLAGGNRWKCDCKLRKLVRLFLPSEGRQNELILSGSNQMRQNLLASSSTSSSTNSNKVAVLIQGTNILQDEPECANQWNFVPGSRNSGKGSTNSMSDVDSVRPSVRRRRRRRSNYNSDNDDDDEDDDNGAAASGITWKNLKLSQFDCAPRAAIEFMSPAATSGTIDTKSGYKEDTRGGKNRILSPEPPRMVEPEKDDGQQERGTSTDDGATNIKSANNYIKPSHRLLKLEPAYYLPSEPLELTCAFYINDELDLDLSQIEWWRLYESTERYSSSSNESENENESGREKSKQQNMLLWRFNETQRWTTMLRQRKLKDEASRSNAGIELEGKGEEYAIIDYVTRANGSRWLSSNYDQQLPLHEDDDEIDGNEQDDLILDNERKEAGQNGHIKLAKLSRVATQVHSKDLPRNQVSLSSIKRPPGGNLDDNKQHLARVIHLIVNPLAESMAPFHQTQETPSSSGNGGREYLCRITNKRGRLEIVYPIRIGSNSDFAHFGAQKRQVLRQRTIDKSTVSQSLNSNWPLSLFDNNEAFQFLSSSSQVADNHTRSINLAKSLIVREMNRQNKFSQSSERGGFKIKKSPLFIPLHLPEELMHNQQDNSSTLELFHELSLAKSFQNQNQDHQQRTTATRQTNGSIVANLLASQSQLPQTTTIIHVGRAPGNQSQDSLNDTLLQPGKNFRRSLNSIALDLITRYTSNKKSLIFGDEEEQGLLLSGRSHLKNSYLSNYDSSNSGEGSLTNILEILRANEKPFSTRIELIMRILLPEKLLNFLNSSPKQILLSIFALITCITIIIYLTSLCRRDKVADSSPDPNASSTSASSSSLSPSTSCSPSLSPSSSSRIKRKISKSSNTVRSQRLKRKKTELSKHADISIIHIRDQEQEQQSPPSLRSGNELDEYVRQVRDTKETHTRPESGSAITTTNGSQAKLINTSSDESQLQQHLNSEMALVQNRILLAATVNKFDIGSSEFPRLQQLDEGVFNSISSGHHNEQASNSFQRFISSGDSLSQSDEMNTELENDVSGTLEADTLENAHGTTGFQIGDKLRKTHLSSLRVKKFGQNDNFCMNYQHCSGNDNIDNNFLPEKYRLIMVSPQEELQELLVPPPYYRPKIDDDYYNYHVQHEQPLDHLRHLSNVSQQMQIISPQIDCQHMANCSPIQSGSQHYKHNNLLWTAADDYRQETILDEMSQQILGGAGNEQFRNVCIQQQHDEHLEPHNIQQFLVEPPPMLRTIGNTTSPMNLISGDCNDNINQQFSRGQQQQQQPSKFSGHKMTLPAQSYLKKISSYQVSSKEQLTSSSSPPASTSSSLNAAISNQSSQNIEQTNQYQPRQQLEQNQNTLYLEDALQLLNTSINDCLRSEHKTNS